MLFYNFCDAGMNVDLALIICLGVSIIVPYILGSLNFGIIFSRLLFKEDVRSKGSGNAGATNMLRNYGKKAGLITFLCDCAKTALSVALGLLFYAHVGMFVAGLFCMLGHMFPVFYKFKGGKGVACLAIIVLMTSIYLGIWYLFFVLFGMFFIIIIGTKFVSLGAVIAAMVYPILLNRMNGANSPYRSVEIFAVIMGLLIVFQHRANIGRLLRGEENKLSFKKKKEETND